MTIQRLVFALCGTAALITGIVGILLPVLPTTPFILLAAWCFARSSERLHYWLYNHPRFGTVIQNWQEHRGIRASHKKKAYLLMIASFALSISIVSQVWLKLMLVVMCICLLFYMRSFKTLP